jgi:hypothetical protein
VLTGRFHDIEDEGCAYPLDAGGRCGAFRQGRSSYCAHHHALCHLPETSRRGRRKLRETEALATAVGGRQGRPRRLPPDPLLRRLENTARGFSRPKCSRIVQAGEAE